MIDSILLALALSAWLVAFSMQLMAWRRQQALPKQVGLSFMLVGSGLSFLALLWRGWTRRHLPLAWPDETFIGLALIIVLLLVWLQWRRAPALYGGLGIGVALMTQAMGLYLPSLPGPGSETLAVWGAFARWLTVLGVAAVGGVAAFSLLSILKQVGDHRPWTASLLPPNGADASASRWLRRTAVVSLSLGTALIFARLWWGWGGSQASRLTWLWLVWLLLLAALWLRFMWPQRRLTSNLLTIAAFACAFPALIML